MTVLFGTFTSNVYKFQLLHILASIRCYCFNFSYSSRCEMVSPYDFNLHFSDNQDIIFFLIKILFI